jgi:hypothetical protein
VRGIVGPASSSSSFSLSSLLSTTGKQRTFSGQFECKLGGLIDKRKNFITELAQLTCSAAVLQNKNQWLVCLTISGKGDNFKKKKDFFSISAHSVVV